MIHITEVLVGLAKNYSTTNHVLTGPFYDPPYESPLEDLYAWNAIKYLDSSVDFQKQIEVDTICGTFRIDFIADHDSKKVAFECDGKKFHDQSRDEWRDAMILGSNAVDVIYRLRGRDLTYNMEDCLFLISKYDPEIFSQRGLINLEQLASIEARGYEPKNAYEPQEGNNIIWLEYFGPNDIHPCYICIERRSSKIPPGKRALWKKLYEYATNRGGGKLDKLIAEYRE